MPAVDEVRRTLHAYCRMLDERRLDDLDQIYLADAVDDRKRGAPLVGHDQIRGYFARSFEHVSATVHLLMNIDVTIDGERATSYSRVLAFHWMFDSGDDPLRPTDFVLTASYDDELALTPDGWRIARRSVGVLGPAGLAIGTLPAVFAGFAGGGRASVTQR